MADLTSVVAFANPPNNILGTILFLSYIILALYFTTSIILSLNRQYNSIEGFKPAKKLDEKVIKEVKDVRRRHIKIYAFLATVSFALLSYQMLSFLIESYLNWARQSSFKGSLVTTESLKAWMLESSLFESFAQELVQDGPSAIWTQFSILATWFWNIWMASKAQQQQLSIKTMVPYLMLSQILPISFTASLFIVQLHLTTLGIYPESTEASKESKSSTNPQPKGALSPVKKKTSLTIPNLLLNASLLALPPLRDHPGFIPLVLFTRFVLLLPYSGRVSLSDADVVQSISISGGCMVANYFMMRKVVSPRDVARGLKLSGRAVQALGWDTQFGLLLAGVLGWGGGL